MRIQLPDTTGAQSLEILRRRALDLWQATHGTNDDLTDAKVFLTYRDGENDLCYVFSEEDLRCAIPPFPTPALKMFARVELPKVESSKKAPVLGTSESQRKSNDAASFKDIPVHKVVESVVGVLSAANLALQNHVKNSHSQGTNTPPACSTANNTAAKSSPLAAASKATEEKSVEVPVEQPFIHGRHTCDGCLTFPIIGDRFRSQTRMDHDLCSSCRHKYEGDDTFEVEELNRDRNMQQRWQRRFSDKVKAATLTEATADPSTQDKTCPPPTEGKEEETAPLLTEERLFIHGRHTCDACLTTPIVGARFHAVNLPDYDLCANCHGNYKDSEIQFEEEELDRDRPMQERWYRRFNKWNQKNQRQAARQQMRQAKREAKQSFKRGCGGPRGNKNMPPPFAPPHHHGVPPRQWNRHQRFAAVPAPTIVAPPPEQVDLALKEAIRRSMEDLKQKEEEAKPAAVVTEPKEAKEEPVEENEKDSVAQEPTDEVAAEEETLPTVETVVPEDAEEEFVIPPEAPVGAHPAVPVSEETVDESNEPVVVKAIIMDKTNAEDSKQKSEDSFSTDAEGNGDVAAALGETMDAIANAIDEMAAELIRSPDDNASEQSAVMVNSVESDSEAKAGATIVSGEEEVEAEESDDGSNASWNLVASDEALARAAQVLGSALFESELSRANDASHGATNEDVSMLGSDHSLPSTLPSVSGSVAQAQIDRWALQLRQLHELGFMNDTANVEIMERLQAANIGSGEEEEISVERVINELMKEW